MKPKAMKRSSEDGGMQLSLKECERELSDGLQAAASAAPAPHRREMDRLCQLTISLLAALTRERVEDDTASLRALALLEQFRDLARRLQTGSEAHKELSNVLPRYIQHAEERIRWVQESMSFLASLRQVYSRYARRERSFVAGGRGVFAALAEAGARPTELEPPAHSRRMDRKRALEELWRVSEDCKEANWDGHGAMPVSQESYQAAYALVEALGAWLPSSVGAEPDGEMTLEWYRDPERVLSVSVGPDRQLHYAAIHGKNRHSGTVSYTGELPWELKQIIQHLWQA